MQLLWLRHVVWLLYFGIQIFFPLVFDALRCVALCSEFEWHFAGVGMVIFVSCDVMERQASGQNQPHKHVPYLYHAREITQHTIILRNLHASYSAPMAGYTAITAAIV
jgi:hypothetical protein